MNLTNTCSILGSTALDPAPIIELSVGTTRYPRSSKPKRFMYSSNRDLMVALN